MIIASVDSILKGSYEVGTEVRVRGWIRTRRDSKAGFSFLAVHDGSCFNPVQVVVPNYQNEYGYQAHKYVTIGECEGYTMDYILSGMKLPIDELTTLYNSYIENSKKVDKRVDNFFDVMSNMRGNTEDMQFDMFSNSSSRKSKADFFASIANEDKKSTDEY